MQKKKTKSNKVTRDMKLSEVVRHYPDSAKIMLEYGLHCVGCFANAFDTIESAMKIHGLSEKDIREMIERINKNI